MNNKGYEVLRNGFDRLKQRITVIKGTLIGVVEGLAFNEVAELEKRRITVENYNGCMSVYEKRKTHHGTVFPSEFAEMNSRLYQNK